jgi:hypothetical protein
MKYCYLLPTKTNTNNPHQAPFVLWLWFKETKIRFEEANARYA